MAVTWSRRQYFGAYEVITGSEYSVFSVLVSSPSAILYRMDRVDFRQTVLKDAVTEQLMRTECMELRQRITEDNVQRDLARDRQWSQFKRELVNSVLEAHQRAHASPLIGPRSPRPFHTVHPPSSPRNASSPRNLKSPGRTVQAGRSVVTSSGHPAVHPTSPARRLRTQSRWMEEFESNIQWSKSAKIMGGLDDSQSKITSAIVSLLNPAEHKR
ncbi:hypothetical protein PINS_up003687 [Pythium insidiosum]|nr:hypothetical protein PINS_up003687 [Pythium insidiosum]